MRKNEKGEYVVDYRRLQILPNLIEGFSPQSPELKGYSQSRLALVNLTHISLAITSTSICPFAAEICWISSVECDFYSDKLLTRDLPDLSSTVPVKFSSSTSSNIIQNFLSYGMRRSQNERHQVAAAQHCREMAVRRHLRRLRPP